MHVARVQIAKRQMNCSSMRLQQREQKTPSVRDLPQTTWSSLMKIQFSSLRKVETAIFILSNSSLLHRCFNAFHRIVTTQRIRSSLPLYFARFARYINLRSLHAPSNRFLPSSTMFIYQFSYTVYGLCSGLCGMEENRRVLRIVTMFNGRIVPSNTPYSPGA